MKPTRVTESILSSVVKPDGYVMERKLDGWRAMVVAGDRVTLWTRERRLIEMPDNLKDQLESLKLPRGTVLDGEIWNPTKRGSWRHDRRTDCLLSLWDAVKVGDSAVGQRPLEERRAALLEMVDGRSRDVTVVEAVPATMDALLLVKGEAEAHRASTNARSGFVHGVVVKRRGSPRRDHCARSVEHPDWMKICFWPQN